MATGTAAVQVKTAQDRKSSVGHSRLGVRPWAFGVFPLAPNLVSQLRRTQRRLLLDPARFLRSAEDRRTLVIELAFPAGDDDGGRAVADQVYAGAAL